MSEVCAYHEAGHAVMAYLCGARVQFVTIDPEWDDDALRHDGEIEVEWPAGKLTDRMLIEASIQVSLAGPAAEMIHTGEPYHPAFVQEWSLDWTKAWSLAAEIAVDEQMRLRLLEKTTREVYHFLASNHVWQGLASLVDELLAHEHMEGAEVHEVLSDWL